MSATDDVRDHLGLPPTPDGDSFTLNFTRVCPKDTCRQTITYVEGQPLPHYCELQTTAEYYGASSGPLRDRVIITRDWLQQLCRALSLNPDTVKSIQLSGREVIVTQYQRDEEDHVQVSSDGAGALIYEDKYLVVG